ncbi:peroxidase 2 [Quercus suber]|uniref:Peroxidase 2 n=1 Tax=Quercus suber TaxID=58331 RepID=A0AAW0MAU3_QUESU
MDPTSSLSFDNHYYKILLQNEGLFQSDAALLTDQEKPISSKQTHLKQTQIRWPCSPPTSSSPTESSFHYSSRWSNLKSKTPPFPKLGRWSLQKPAKDLRSPAPTCTSSLPKLRDVLAVGKTFSTLKNSTTTQTPNLTQIDGVDHWFGD